MISRFTIDQQRYMQILTRCIPDLRQFCCSRHLAFRGQFFQQDCATCQAAAAVRQFLQDHFPSKFISLFADFPYPSDSRDAYLWGMAKTDVFKLAQQAVRVFFADLRQPLFTNITSNVVHRYEVCLERGKAHLEHVIKYHQ